MLIRIESVGRHQPALPAGLSFNTETLDLGVVPGEGTARGTFELTNGSPATYRIEKVTPECGCTVVELPQTLLLPRSSAKIPVSIRGSAWGDGLRTKHIAVIVVDEQGTHSTIVLSVTAAVRRVTLLAFAPAHLDVPYSAPGSLVSVPIFVRGDKAVVDLLPKIIDVSQKSESHVSVSATHAEGRRASREILLSLRAPQERDRNDTSTTLVIDISGAHIQTVQVPIHLHVSSRNADSGAGARTFTDKENSHESP